MLTVEKIGGTSMSAFADVLPNIIFHGRGPANRSYRVVAETGFALSAFC